MAQAIAMDNTIKANIRAMGKREASSIRDNNNSIKDNSHNDVEPSKTTLKDKNISRLLIKPEIVGKITVIWIKTVKLKIKRIK